MFRIKFYKDIHGNEPIKMFLDDLKEKAATNKIERVRFKKIVEYLRVFFFHWRNRIFILLHHFAKKTKKTPPSEIAQAKRNQKDFLENYEERGFL